MKTLHLSADELSKIINSNTIIGNGSFGLVVKLNDNILLKFNYKDFIDAFLVENNEICLNKLGNISPIIEKIKNVNQIIYNDLESDRVKMIKLAIAKQSNIKHSTLTQGLVYVNNFCVGYLLKYHKNMISLFQYLKSSNISKHEKNDILNKIKVSMNELIDNNIYLEDFSTGNILYNPLTKELQIIDFEDSLIICDKKNLYREKIMRDKFALIKQAINKNNQDENT